uniref:Uncharacterized protein MANES_04G070300 n=1 Tax=Rhizophora mucronata TaxID=61149 RepID=A0A2P2JSR8_RHIMU
MRFKRQCGESQEKSTSTRPIQRSSGIQIYIDIQQL